MIVVAWVRVDANSYFGARDRGLLPAATTFYRDRWLSWSKIAHALSRILLASVRLSEFAIYRSTRFASFKMIGKWSLKSPKQDLLRINPCCSADWETESAGMSQIYANAYLTIAAVHPKVDSPGFLTCRPSATISVTAPATIDSFLATVRVRLKIPHVETPTWQLVHYMGVRGPFKTFSCHLGLPVFRL